MKKKEIIKLIEANLNIIKSNELLENIKTPFDYLEEQQCFLDIAELKLQFGILRKEVKIGIKKTEEAKKFIKTIKCNHEVRLNYYGDYSSYSICVLCGEKIEGDNILNWELRRDRNKYSIVLDAKDQYDYFIPDGYTNEDVYNIIFKILEDKELDEEVDLVQEFKKLNLKRCMINTFQKFDENFILIIGGSNKWYIDDESYITKSSVTHTYHDLDIYNNQEKDIISLKILSYFSGLLDTKVELLENLEVYQSKQFQNNFQDKDKNLNFKTYNTIEELDNKLESQTKIPFKFVIDVSSLFEYKIENDNILKKSFQLPLEKYFPNSKIIRIKDLLNNTKLSDSNLKDICNKVKKILKKMN